VERVIVGVSGSLGNLAALHTAVDEARRSDALLIALSAWTPGCGDVAHRRSPFQPQLQKWREGAQDRLRTAFVDAFGGPPPDLEIECLAAQGDPRRLLVGLARRPGDLLVVGTGRRGRFARLRRGSVSRYCLAHAQCRILAVPQPELLEEFRRGRLRLRESDFAPLPAS
jgi:nucleotide-binding universal stress UspA family protein